MKQLSFEVVSETRPGERFRALFEQNWPTYRAWYLDEGESARPTYLQCTEALEEHMPELYPVYREILELLDAADLQARFLSLSRPPPFFSVME